MRRFALLAYPESFFTEQQQQQGNKNMRQVKFIAAALVVALSAIAAPAAFAADKTDMDATVEVGKPLQYLKPLSDDQPVKLNGIADLKKES